VWRSGVGEAAQFGVMVVAGMVTKFK